MPITYKNTNIERVEYNGVDLNKVIFNDTIVFTKGIVGDIAIDIEYLYTRSSLHDHMIYATITAARLINGPFPTAITFWRTGTVNPGGIKIGTIQPGDTEIKSISASIYMTIMDSKKQYEYVTIQYTDVDGTEKLVNVELDTTTQSSYNTTTIQQISYD